MEDVTGPVESSAHAPRPHRGGEADELLDYRGFTGLDGFWYPCDRHGAVGHVESADGEGRTARQGST